MTLKQMEYAIVVAKCASLSEAAKRLFVSQPSLSESIKKLEEELGVQLFVRERTGVTLTEAGEEFLNAAQSIMDQVSNIERKFDPSVSQVEKVSVSTIHFFFIGEVFAEMVNEAEKRGYDAFEVKTVEAGTLEVINDVLDGLSDIGIVSYTDHNRTYIMKELKKYNLDFYELASMQMKIYVRKDHPITRMGGKVSLVDLEEYPYASIWQNKSREYYFTEEGIFIPANKKRVYLSDSGSVRTLLRETDAFAMGIGILPADMEGSELTSVELMDAPMQSICWIRKSGQNIPDGARVFLRICAQKLGRGQFV